MLINIKESYFSKYINNERGINQIIIALTLIIMASIILFFIFNGSGSEKDGLIETTQNVTENIVETIINVNSTNH